VVQEAFAARAYRRLRLDLVGAGLWQMAAQGILVSIFAIPATLLNCF